MYDMSAWKIGKDVDYTVIRRLIYDVPSTVEHCKVVRVWAWKMLQLGCDPHYRNTHPPSFDISQKVRTKLFLCEEQNKKHTTAGIR